MYPLVLIKSFGMQKSSYIMSELLRANGDSVVEPMSIYLDSHNLMVYKLSISTRYYKTSVLLFECNDLTSIPTALKNKIEGSIFYFDSFNLNLLSELKTVVKFVHENNIGVSTLITQNMNENTLHKITYDELKSICKLDISVVDLNVENENEEAVGFAEVLELLKNHIWSSVHISIPNSNKIYQLEENYGIFEENLNEFEELLNKFQQFKDVSQTMHKEEVLKNAENLAELFANLLNED